MKKIAIIASGENIDAAYKVLNIANAAATMDVNVVVFCTFGGLQLLFKEPQYPMIPMLEPFKENLKTIPTITELRESAIELGVTFIACQMTMDLMGITSEHLVDGITTAGAASFLEEALDADSTITF